MRRRRIGVAYRLAVVVCVPASRLLTRRRWEGVENVPECGGVVVAANHLSHADPITLGHALWSRGRLPRFLAKDELFRIPVLRGVLRGAGQIPVIRGSVDAGIALAAASAAVQAGECVVIYPEGTTTRDPARWPMRGRTGVARLALATDAPLLPLAHWGAQNLHDRDLGWRLRRTTVTTRIGAPIDLSAYRGRPPTPQVLREVTDLVMAEIRAMLADIRGEPAPDAVYGAPQPEAGGAARPAAR